MSVGKWITIKINCFSGSIFQELSPTDISFVNKLFILKEIDSYVLAKGKIDNNYYFSFLWIHHAGVEIEWKEMLEGELIIFVFLSFLSPSLLFPNSDGQTLDFIINS